MSTEQPFKLKGAIYLRDRKDKDWRDENIASRLEHITVQL
ncbi:hypothetical protein [Lactococcus lactis]|nr:hypothetical protein [Lactococcus lactis]